MSNENLKDSLSALMDNAADDLEIRRLLAHADDEIMATWSRYQIARSVMQEQVIFPKLDIASAVSEAIASEEIASKQPVSAAVHYKTQFWNHLGKFAVAASIMAITLSVVFFINNDEDLSASVTSYAQNEEVIVEGLNIASNEQWIENRLSDFIDRHEKQGVFVIDEYDQTPYSADVISN
ncbi:sigma-E factor negative regulatory protein [Entomomonas asaccharolytica]|uniref:Anti sigma-E protein RseA N-terminal domain-containing protein n=1 Tax=Entomomonas asaccharolytica TaxID=2785331 RepID=A0A974RW94_9GAMM|nr:RseA family anti-sigma factor [Entomomonas asaccharolytica]QQP84892.1 hypothetical protein JHT90_10840 [Entomomonas asaccharolytica]